MIGLKQITYNLLQLGMNHKMGLYSLATIQSPSIPGKPTIYTKKTSQIYMMAFLDFEMFFVVGENN